MQQEKQLTNIFTGWIIRSMTTPKYNYKLKTNIQDILTNDFYWVALKQNEEVLQKRS